MKPGTGPAALIAAPVLLVLGGFLAFLLLLTTPAAATTDGGCTGPAATAHAGVPTIDGYQGVQLDNAAAVMTAASALHLTVQAQIIGVMTAMGESGLRVLPYGDTAGPDSRGLFQQRNNWGTLADRMDPTRSATKFFTALKTVPGWAGMTPTLAAHAVQGNADPYYYTTYLAPARDVVAHLGDTITDCSTTQAAGDDYPWPSQPTDLQGGGLSPLGYYYRECVDFAAWRLNRDAHTRHTPFTYTWATLTPLGGDAIRWRTNWAAHGWTISTTPHPGDIAWWGTTAGPAGHVAYVQTITGSQITVEEYNWGGHHGYDQRTIPAASPGAYLEPPP